VTSHVTPQLAPPRAVQQESTDSDPAAQTLDARPFALARLRTRRTGILTQAAAPTDGINLIVAGENA
jgi:hypothetical protein